MERIGNIIVDQVGSYMSLDENMSNLKRKCETLHSREVDVNTELEYAESSCGKKRRKVVEDWLINVGNIRNEVQSIDATLSQSGRRERLKLASRVENLTKEVGELLEQGKFPQGLTLNTPHDGGVDLLTKPLVGQAFQESVGKITEGTGKIIEGARQVGTYVSIDDSVETLKRKCEDLGFRAEDVKTELGNAESSSREKRRKTVENWLTDVQNFRNQVDAALSQTGILQRPQLACKVENLTGLADVLLEQGKFPQGLTLYTPHDGGVELLTKPLVGRAFQENLEKIWGYM